MGSPVVAVGAYGKKSDLAPGAQHGAVYLFTPAGTQVAKLTASDEESQAWFGHSVSISGVFVVIGSHRRDENGNDDSGAAYIFSATCGNPFDADASPCVELGKVTPSDAAEDDDFGYSVAISSNKFVVGARGKSSESVYEGGAAYVFEIVGASYESGMGGFNVIEMGKVKWPVSLERTQQAGTSVAIGGGTGAAGIDNTVVVGSLKRGTPGSAAIFEV